MRLGHPHLEPGDEASFFSAETSAGFTDVVVSIQDERGRTFYVRPPVSAREIGALHEQFVGAQLEVSFHPHHQFLIAVDERGTILGGLFYSVDQAAQNAHMEKMVVAERCRHLGVGDSLMSQLFKRMASMGLRTVTTGFYRRSYFYRLGFAVEGRYAGLVKHLE
jgi:GNAT superfamily N-acetyltransferase